jgi:hypothetical protein
MRYWWVNQNQTFELEVPGGFLWSPKTKSDGAKNYFYDIRRTWACPPAGPYTDAHVLRVPLAV